MDYINLVHGFGAVSEKTEESSDHLDKVWYTFQRIIAGLLLTAVLPILVTLCILVKATSTGPFLFRQKRAGLNGNPFFIYKIRTMEVGSEKGTALGVKNSNPQITRIGRILRILKFDELPQLLNILKGEMAFVGPRPIPLKLEDELKKSIRGFHRRYEVSPGLTSIGQICIEDNATGDEMIADWRMRFSGELHYIENKCIGYDILMISMTVLYVVKKAFR